MTDIDAGVKAKVLRSAAAATHPRTALPTIAGNHHLTFDQVKGIVEAHGWPRPASMLRAAAILEQKAATATSPGDTGADVFEDVDTTRLTPDPDNVREDLGDLTDLMDSMTTSGLLQPVVVRRHEDALIVVTGHRRLAAAKRLGWSTVPTIIKTGFHPDDVLAAMLVENTQRLNLDPIEEARALGELKRRHHLSDFRLAAKVSRSQSHVSARLALLDLTPADQAAIRAGTMNVGTGTTRGRTLSGKTRTGAQGKKSAAHLTDHHPLAGKVAQLCRSKGHNKHTPGRVGGVGCGRCWEAVIREDERTLIGGN